MAFMCTAKNGQVMDTYKKDNIISVPESGISHICGNCKHYAEYEGVCCYYKSEHVADCIAADDGCQYWMEKDND